MRDISKLYGKVVRVIIFQPLNQHPQAFFGKLSEESTDGNVWLEPLDNGPGGVPLSIEGINPGVDGSTNIPLTDNTVVTEVAAKYIKPLDMARVEALQQQMSSQQGFVS